ncbi:MAG: SRPBCC family protein [Mycobacteriales bacterium]
MTNVIEASTDIDAPPREVWEVVSDLKRMGEWSPQCRRMHVFGDVRLGARTLNLNHQGRVFWPTDAKVVRYEPQRAIAFRITVNRTVWTYELTETQAGTRLTERREVPEGISRLSGFLTGKVLGSTPRFERGLQRGIEQTLARIKAEVEHQPAAS